MRNKNLIFAFVISVIGALLIYLYLSGKEKEVTAKGVSNKVLVASKFIPAGAAVPAGSLKLGELPELYIQPGALRKFEEAAGVIALANIAEGEQILANKVTRLAENLSSLVPIGYRAVTLNLDADSSAGDFLKPGDIVDLLASFEEAGKASYTATLIQCVRVLAVNESFSSVKKSEAVYFPVKAFSGNIIVLALEPSDSELLTFAENKGRIKVVLRNPGDEKTAVLKATNFGNALRNQLREAVKPAPEVPFLEVIRGTEGEKVILKGR